MKKILTILLIIFIWLINAEAKNVVSEIGHVSNELIGEPIYNKDVIIYSNKFENTGSFIKKSTKGDCDSYFLAQNNNGLTIDFEAFTMSMSPTEFDWDYGDGTTGVGQFVTHTYEEPGLYPVTLHSIDSTACEFTYEEIVRVFGQGGDCEAYYIYIQSPGMNGIQFLDQSWGGPTSWTWNFGDGTTSGEQNPIHEFEEAGEYEVCLSIFCEETGCEDTYCEIVIVEGTSSDCESFFEAINNNGLTVDFEAYTMSMFPTEFDWNFGDGTVGTGQSISHTYDEAGLYLVTLHSIDSTGCEYTYEEEVRVFEPGGDCEAFYIYFQDSLSNEIQFFDQSIGNPTNWFWEFGDGTASGEQNPIHEFEEAGEYEVCLSIFCEETGCEDTYCEIIVVEQYPDCFAQFSYELNSQNSIEVIFTDESFGLSLTWLWNFGDGASSTEQNPVHIYSEGGEYNVCLWIYSLETQCESDTCVMISVIQPCEAGFLYEQDQENPLRIEFTDQSIGNITQWIWDFGDGTISYLQNPVHIYPDSGLYNVCLNVSDVNTIEYCNDTYCDFVDIEDVTGCSANFIALVDSTSKVPYLYYYYDKTIGNTVSWQWDFGDGDTSIEQNPIHVYQEPGDYVINLKITNDNPIGLCVDSISKQITTPNYFDLGGSAFIGDHPLNNPVFEYDTGIAYLYRSFDDDEIIPIDTIEFYDYGYYWFKEIMEGEYLVKTKLSQNSTHSRNFLPSYYTNELLWENANKIILADSNFYSANLYMVSTDYVQENGVGRIGGHVFQNEKSGNDVYQNVEVLLFNEECLPLIYEYTNEFGEFEFDKLEFGTYKLQTEVTGKYSLSRFITIDETTPVIDTINLEFSNNPSGISEDYIFVNKTAINIFPNPVHDIINIEINLSKSADIELRIINCFGQIFAEKNYFLSPQNNNIKLSVKNLSPGMYLLSITSVKNKLFESIKFIKK
jgi:PKD repeat protein